VTDDIQGKTHQRLLEAFCMPKALEGKQVLSVEANRNPLRRALSPAILIADYINTPIKVVVIDSSALKVTVLSPIPLKVGHQTTLLLSHGTISGVVHGCRQEGLTFAASLGIVTCEMEWCAVGKNGERSTYALEPAR
jgi:hypothetical protein